MFALCKLCNNLQFLLLLQLRGLLLRQWLFFSSGHSSSNFLAVFPTDKPGCSLLIVGQRSEQNRKERQTVVFYEYLDLFFFLSFLITLWGTPFLMCSHSLASLAALSCIIKLQLILCSQGLLQEFSKVGPEPEYFFCCFPRLSAGRLFPQSLGPSLPIMIPRVSAWVSFFTSPNQTLSSQDSVVNLLQFFILFLIDGSLV